MESRYLELDSLYKELRAVEAYDGDYLPKYGYSSKTEIIELIKEDIADIENCKEPSYDYTKVGLIQERAQLCHSQGMNY
ncbi:MAG: hypothetical protein ACRCUJ_07795 [Phocaeicola sp.]